MNDVRIYALEHYDPALVAINYAALAAFPRPASHNPPTRDLYRKRKPTQLKYELFKQAINYCYWTIQDGNYEEWTAHGLAEAHAMAAGMQAYLDDRDFDKHFPGIPLKEDRVAALYDIQLRQDSVNEIVNCTRAHKLVQFNLAEMFPVAFGGDPFKKREILFKAITLDIIDPTSTEKVWLPVAADYQLPRALRHYGVLTYSPELAAKVDSYQLLEANSKEETAIRAATVIACDQLATLWQTFPFVVDQTLWGMRNDATAPHHLTITTAY